MKKSYVSILAGIGLVFTSCGDFLSRIFPGFGVCFKYD